MLSQHSMDPHTHVRRFEDYKSSLMMDECDFLVVGTGPSGAVVALEMARAGFDVVVVEEGAPLGPKEFTPEPTASVAQMYKGAGLLASHGNIAMPVMQPSCLGGGSVMNSAICVRAPEMVFSQWRKEHGIDWINTESLAPHYDKIRDYWGIKPVEMEAMGRRNLLFKEACENLGIEGHPIERNEEGCRGCAECFSGCPSGAKRSTDRTFIPDAITAGARVYANMRAEELIIQGNRIAGMKLRAVESKTQATGPLMEIRARCTVLAAGVFGTPVLLQKNGKIANSSGMVGRNLIFHPGATVMGIFEEVVNPWEGATQGYASTQFIEQGFKLESFWAPPAVLATRFPHFGASFKDCISQYKHMAPFAVVESGVSKGEVLARKNGWTPKIKYHLQQQDADILRLGLAKAAKLMEACGAHTVLPGIHSLPKTMKADQASALIESRPVKPNYITSVAAHVFGTTRMGGDPKTSVVDPDGKAHDHDDLYIVDTGIMPTCTRINPMFTIMAMADRIAGKLKSRY